MLSTLKKVTSILHGRDQTHLNSAGCDTIQSDSGVAIGRVSGNSSILRLLVEVAL